MEATSDAYSQTPPVTAFMDIIKPHPLPRQQRVHPRQGHAAYCACHKADASECLLLKSSDDAFAITEKLQVCRAGTLSIRLITWSECLRLDKHRPPRTVRPDPEEEASGTTFSMTTTFVAFNVPTLRPKLPDLASPSDRFLCKPERKHGNNCSSVGSDRNLPVSLV